MCKPRNNQASHHPAIVNKPIDRKDIQQTFAPIVTALFDGASLERIERLTGGVSADVYRLDLLAEDGTKRSVVLRAHGETHSGHTVDLEFALLDALHRVGLRVPKPLHKDAGCTSLPHPYLIIEHIEGSSEIPAEQADSFIETMAESLYGIHSTPLESLPNLPLRNNPLPELFEFLPNDAEWDPLKTHLASLTNTTYAGAVVLLHGDFWPENLLWQNARLHGILDWEDAALGDPLSDVAASGLELRYKFGPQAMYHFIQAYGRTQPIDDQRLALWQVYVAAAAQHFMANWGLEPAREQHMRSEAIATIAEAGDKLMQKQAD